MVIDISYPTREKTLMELPRKLLLGAMSKKCTYCDCCCAKLLLLMLKLITRRRLARARVLIKTIYAGVSNIIHTPATDDAFGFQLIIPL